MNDNTEPNKLIKRTQQKKYKALTDKANKNQKWSSLTYPEKLAMIRDNDKELQNQLIIRIPEEKVKYDILLLVSELNPLDFSVAYQHDVLIIRFRYKEDATAVYIAFPELIRKVQYDKEDQ